MTIPQEISEKIAALPKPAIVAISDFGGSGKSTAAHTLGEFFGAPVICIDKFSKDRTKEDFTHWEGMDFDRFESEVLIPFKAEENPIRYGHWDHGENSIVKTVEVPHEGLLIVEGVGLFRPHLLRHFDYKVWIECPQEEATARGKKRDREVHLNPQDEKWDGIWKRNDLEYFEDLKPKEKADAVIDNCA
jgi:uridine kinase